MIRSEILPEIVPILRPHLVVCTIGLPSQELHMIDDQPTYAGMKTKLEKVAEACGCENVVVCQDVDTGEVLQAAIDAGKMTVIVVKCDSGNIELPVITIDSVVIRDRFMRAVMA